MWFMGTFYSNLVSRTERGISRRQRFNKNPFSPRKWRLFARGLRYNPILDTAASSSDWSEKHQRISNRSEEGRSCSRIGQLPIPSSLRCPRLQLAENIQHLRRSVRVVVDYLPRFGFLTFHPLLDQPDEGIFDKTRLRRVCVLLSLPVTKRRFLSTCRKA